MKRIFSLCLLCSISFSCWAQLPQTEIWVFDLKLNRAGYAISNPIKVKVGDEYNNQPYFTPDGETMYFVSNAKKGGKTDIYAYRFNSRKKIKRITRTKRESEYSPMLTPDQERISCVRVARDTVTQNFVTYDFKGKKAKILFPEIKDIGYYCWRTQMEFIAFHLPEPFSLRKHNLAYNTHEGLNTNIGRCLINNRNQLLYVDKSDSTDWKIKMINPKRIGLRKYENLEPDQVISSTLEGEEDYAFIRGKDLLMGKDGFIYWKKDVFNNPNATWEAIFDLNHFKIYRFYRIAVSPTGNKLAVVAYSGTKP